MDDFSINSTLVSVPAPASIAILALGLAGLRLSRKNNNV
ncbi:PEP-CTERM sorting domain-containing protein [Moritella dasanensis]|nr:PEP-CTERM sorting domain-containing protein [Moritella dasanensis]